VNKADIHQIVTLLNDMREGIREGEACPMQLTELYRVIRLLMDATFVTEHQRVKVLLASLEYRARQYK
jgi:hypothetical protein